jgi:hypothetical protein
MEALEYVRFESKAGTAYSIATDGKTLICLYWKLDTDEKIREPVHIHHSNMCLLEDDKSHPCVDEGETGYTTRTGKELSTKGLNVQFPDWRFVISECSKDPTHEKTIDLGVTEAWSRFVKKFGTNSKVKMWVRRGIIMAPYRYDGVMALADNTKALYVQMPLVEPSEYILPTFT